VSLPTGNQLGAGIGDPVSDPHGSKIALGIGKKTESLGGGSKTFLAVLHGKDELLIAGFPAELCLAALQQWQKSVFEERHIEIPFGFLAEELDPAFLKIHIPPAEITSLCLTHGCGTEELNEIRAFCAVGIELVGAHMGEDLVKLLQGGDFPLHLIIFSALILGFEIGIGAQDPEGNGMIEEAFKKT